MFRQSKRELELFDDRSIALVGQNFSSLAWSFRLILEQAVGLATFSRIELPLGKDRKLLTGH